MRNEFLITIPNHLFYGLRSLDICYNNITKLDHLPFGLTHLYICHNKITRLENLPTHLLLLDICNNDICKLENLPDTLIRLHINSNKINKIQHLPPSLLRLDICYNNIDRIENLPDTVKFGFDTPPSSLLDLNICHTWSNKPNTNRFQTLSSDLVKQISLTRYICRQIWKYALPADIIDIVCDYLQSYLVNNQ